MSLARAAAKSVSFSGATFWKTRSSLIEGEEEEEADPDLGLDPADAKSLAWRDWNRAVAESARAWASTAVTWAQAGMARDAGGHGAGGDGLHGAVEGERSEDSRAEVVTSTGRSWR